MKSDMLVRMLPYLALLGARKISLPFGKIFWEIIEQKNGVYTIHVSYFPIRTKRPDRIRLWDFTFSGTNLMKFDDYNRQSSSNVLPEVSPVDNAYLVFKSIGYMLDKKITFGDVSFTIQSYKNWKGKTMISVKDAPARPFQRDILFIFQGRQLSEVITDTM